MASFDDRIPLSKRSVKVMGSCHGLTSFRQISSGFDRKAFHNELDAHGAENWGSLVKTITQRTPVVRPAHGRLRNRALFWNNVESLKRGVPES